MSDYFHYQNDALYVEQVPLADIAAQFGTPCYVYSRAALTDSLRQFTDALQGREHLIFPHLYLAQVEVLHIHLIQILLLQFLQVS